MLEKFKGFAKAGFVLFIVLTIGFLITFKHSIQLIANDETLTITGKDQIASVSGSGSTKFVYANNSTYEVADSYLEMTFNSRDRYGKLAVGKTYDVKTRGLRISFLSMQPNIVKIYQEVPPKPAPVAAVPKAEPVPPTATDNVVVFYDTPSDIILVDPNELAVTTAPPSTGDFVAASVDQSTVTQ